MSPIKKNVIFLSAVILGVWCLFITANHWRAEYSFNQGIRLSAQKRNGDAMIHFQRAVNLFPSEDFYRMHQGRNILSYANNSNLPKPTRIKLARQAETIFKDLMQRDNLNPWYSLRLSEVYSTLSNIEPDRKAEYLLLIGSALEHSATVDANNPIFLLTYGQYLHATTQYKKALPLLQEVFETDPSLLNSATTLGKTYRVLGRHQEALEVFKEVYQRNPRVLDSIYNLSQAYFTVGDYQMALRIIQPYGKNEKSPQKLRDYYQFLLKEGAKRK